VAQQETLELVATAVDRASGILRQVKRSMDDIKRSGADPQQANPRRSPACGAK